MKTFTLAATLLMTGSSAWADATTGAAFLRIGTGARPEALGGAFTALADDVNALHYNPGGLSQLAKTEVGFTHTQWLLDSKFDFAGIAQPFKFGTVGLAASRLGTGSQEARDENRRAIGDFSASDSAYALGFGRSLGSIGSYGTLGVGADLKYLESRIGSDSASTFALDAGAVHRLHNLPLSLGLSVLNVGRGMKFISQRDPLPLTIALGAAYGLRGLFNLVVDLRHEPYDHKSTVGAGVEYAVLPIFAIRAGYASPTATAMAGNTSILSGFGGGFGLKIRDYRADYTFTPFGELGNVQRISLGARF